MQRSEARGRLWGAFKFGEHPRCLVHGRHLGIGRPLENVGKFQPGAASDVEDPDGLVGLGNPCGGSAMEAGTVVPELRIPKMGNVVEEFGEALSLEIRWQALGPRESPRARCDAAQGPFVKHTPEGTNVTSGGCFIKGRRGWAEDAPGVQRAC